MKPKNFPGRKAVRKIRVTNKLYQVPPHIKDMKFRLGRYARMNLALILTACVGQPFTERESDGKRYTDSSIHPSSGGSRNTLESDGAGLQISDTSPASGGSIAAGGVQNDAGSVGWASNPSGGSVSAEDSGLSTSGGAPNIGGNLESGINDSGISDGPTESQPEPCRIENCPYSTYREPPCCRNPTTCGVVFTGSGHACIEWR